MKKQSCYEYKKYGLKKQVKGYMVCKSSLGAWKWTGH